MLEFPETVGGPWNRYLDRATVKAVGGTNHSSPSPSPSGGGEPEILIGTVRYPRVVPREETAARELKRRTLTNLYNERPTWPDLAHRRLDETVFAAYGWSVGLSDDELLATLLALNLERSAS